MSATHKKQTIDTADYVAVINTIGAYCQAIDAQDEAALVELFDEKAKLSVPLLGDAGEFVGSDGVKAFLSAVKARAHKGGIHVESNVVVGNSGSWFTNVSYWHAVHRGNITSYGKHEDLLKIVDGTAKFVSRKIVHLWTRDAPRSAATARSSAAPKASSGASTAPAAPGAPAASSSGRRSRRSGAAVDRSVTDVMSSATTLYVARWPKPAADAKRDAVETLLKDAFAPFGAVSRVVVRNSFAYVEFADAAAADKALAAKVRIQDAELHVERKRAAPPATTTAN
jgi:hypothetical protein